MYDAQTLYVESAGSVTIMSDWLPRGADNIRLTLDLVRMSSGITLTVSLLHKNQEDTGDGTQVGSAITATSSSGARQAVTISSVKELVRFKYNLASDVADEGHAHFRLLSPIWFNAAK